MLLFLEYYFTVMYKPCKTHVVVNALSRLLNITKPICVFDQTIDVRLFYIELEWLNDVNCFFENKADWRNILCTTKAKISQESKTFHIEEWWIVQNGSRQQTTKMFDNYISTNSDERTT